MSIIQRCPACNHDIDAATAADGTGAKAKEGDLSICFYCASVLQFRASLSLAVFDVNGLDAETRALVLRIRDLTIDQIARRAGAPGGAA